MNTAIPKNNKVLLGLSGGVDSTAAALLLQEKGFRVTGLFFDVLGNQVRERAAAEQAASELGIPFVYRNVKEAFQDKIIRYFCDSYLKGETPNPCILCNPMVKFRILEEEADRIGAYYLATGHYARIEHCPSSEEYYIARGINARKDQSYMMYRLGQRFLRRLLLPLGTTEEKAATRQLVREKGIHNADKKDSQEICFIKEGSYIDYILGQGYEISPGSFVDQEGRVLGGHQGLPYYTIGQRKGLGVTFGKPTFVTRLDPLKNQVVLGDDRDLFHRVVYADETCFSLYEDGLGPLPGKYEGALVNAKIRYAAKPAKARLCGCEEGRIKIIFEEPQRAASPGQSVALYDGDRLLGGGFITSASQGESC